MKVNFFFDFFKKVMDETEETKKREREGL